MSGTYKTPDGQKVHGDGKPVGRVPDADSQSPVEEFVKKLKAVGIWEKIDSLVIGGLKIK